MNAQKKKHKINLIAITKKATDPLKTKMQRDLLVIKSSSAHSQPQILIMVLCRVSRKNFHNKFKVCLFFFIKPSRTFKKYVEKLLYTMSLLKSMQPSDIGDETVKFHLTHITIELLKYL